jgi:pimeloyl-ACP methyl ester carboxylesterase
LIAAALVADFGDSAPALAQDDNKPIEENFLTADGVRLKGLFHKAPKPAAGNPVVVLLYQPGPGNNLDKPGDWAGLTKTLNDKGFHVFRFDWRGHGKSKDIVDTDNFWNNAVTGPWNKKYVNGANKKPIKNDIDVKNDIKPGYLPMYAQDLAAVRNHLDGKNDQNDLNTSSIYLIGAGDTTAIGMLWMAQEWIRPAIHPLLGGGMTYKITPMNGITVDPEAGRDIAAAIWLSPSRPAMIQGRTIQDWSTNALKMRENNHSLFLYGEKDSAGASGAKFYYDQVLVAKGNKALGVKALDQTFEEGLKNTNLKGVALLGNDAMLGTETKIVKFLEGRQKDRAAVVRRKRDYPGPYFINLGYFGLNP